MNSSAKGAIAPLLETCRLSSFLHSMAQLCQNQLSVKQQRISKDSTQSVITGDAAHPVHTCAVFLILTDSPLARHRETSFMDLL